MWWLAHGEHDVPASADWLSPPMIRPLVLARQPCMTPVALHSFGNGVAGSGGGGSGLVGGGGVIAGSVVNGWDWASSNRAHPEPTSNAAHSSTASRSDMLRVGAPSLMQARLRIPGQCAPRRPLFLPVAALAQERVTTRQRCGYAAQCAAPIPCSAVTCTYAGIRDR